MNREESCYQSINKRCKFTPNTGTGKPSKYMIVGKDGKMTNAEKARPVKKTVEVDGVKMSMRAYKTKRQKDKAARRKSR